MRKKSRGIWHLSDWEDEDSWGEDMVFDKKKSQESASPYQRSEGSGFPSKKRGRVVEMGFYIKVFFEGEIYRCRHRGRFLHTHSSQKNIIVVGDWVYFINLEKGKAWIVGLEERFSFLSRADALSHRKEQMLAANIDQALIVVSLVSPPLKIPLIDRYLIAAKKGSLSAIVLMNKIDLLKSEADIEHYRACIDQYEKVGVKILPISLYDKSSLQELSSHLKGKVSVFFGQSGVGKSSLINHFCLEQQRVGEGMTKAKKGKHTTTQARLLPLICGGFTVDTPGIKSFALWNLQREDIEEHFSEIRSFARACSYRNCRHGEEKDCAVKAALEEKKLSPFRFASYKHLLESLDTVHLRR